MQNENNKFFPRQNYWNVFFIHKMALPKPVRDMISSRNPMINAKTAKKMDKNTEALSKPTV